MVSGDSGEFPSLERLAEEAGVHKMTIYRIFGSQAELARACAASLREREDIAWRETAERCRNSTGCQVRALFRILTEQLRDDPRPGQQLDLIASRLGEASDMIREAVDARRQAVRELLLECLKGRSGYDSDALADVLLLLWVGASVPSRSEEERNQLVEALPAIVDRIMGPNAVQSTVENPEGSPEGAS
jgi:AcrR family transcriptional regulator